MLALGELFTVKVNPAAADDDAEIAPISSYPRLVAATMAHTSSMVGVRAPKLSQKVVRHYDVYFCLNTDSVCNHVYALFC